MTHLHGSDRTNNVYTNKIFIGVKLVITKQIPLIGYALSGSLIIEITLKIKKGSVFRHSKVFKKQISFHLPMFYASVT